MCQPLAGKKILIFVGEIYEDLEVWYPRLRLIEAGAKVVMAGPEAKQEYAGKNGDTHQRLQRRRPLHLAANPRRLGSIPPHR